MIVNKAKREFEILNKTVKKEGGGWWTSVVKDESQLEEVFKYYENDQQVK